MNDGKKRTIKRVIQRCGCDKILPLTLVYIFYVILHGHLSPGGGFQGGVLMVAVVILIYLGHGYDVTLKSLRPDFLHHSEGFLSFLYIIAALLGVVYLGNFCQNVFSDIGNIGELFQYRHHIYYGHHSRLQGHYRRRCACNIHARSAGGQGYRL